MHLFVRENGASGTDTGQVQLTQWQIFRSAQCLMRKKSVGRDVNETQGTPDAYLMMGAKTSQAKDIRKYGRRALGWASRR